MLNCDRSLRGVFPILYTPFDAEGNVDEEDLRRLVDYLVQSGAHGLAAVGGASECHKLSMDERKWMAEVVVNHAAGRVPVIVGTSAPHTEEAVELSVHAERIGARAVFLTPPTQGPTDDGAILAHYRTVASAVRLAVMIQDAGIPVRVPVMVALHREMPNIVYVKEESPHSGHLITEILQTSQGSLLPFSGGRHPIEELTRGAIGLIPGSLGVPHLAQAYNSFCAGDIEGARTAWERYLPFAYWRQPSALLRTKEVLRRIGIFKAAYLREPSGGARMDEIDHAELTALMQRHGPPF